MWGYRLNDAGLIAWYIGVLVFLEGLLSADNALVLALMVRHLSRRDQRRVLRWGIWGAVAFRVVAVLLSAFLLKFWFFKVLGGAYLLFLAISHFVSPGGSNGAEGENQGSRARRWLRGFWGTVVSITMADIAFSIDSILAAVAMADSFPDRFGDRGKLFIVLTGGILGIITMRFVVRYFVAMLDRFPGLAEGAYYLVAWIGLKLLLSGFSDWALTPAFLRHHIPEWLFWSVMLLIAVVSMLVKRPPGGPEASEGLDLLDHDEDSSADLGHNPPADGSDGPRRSNSPSSVRQ
jgi:YkoY family integral membrane protein